MKKLLVFVFVAIMILSFVGCSHEKVNSSSQISNGTSSSESAEEQIKRYTLGETVSTDILEFTLDRAELAIALHDGTAGDYNEICLPKEYEAGKDDNRLFVAAKGHTLIGFQFTVNNLDRVNLKLADNSNFLSIEYDGKLYDWEPFSTYESDDGFDWSFHNGLGVMVEVNQKLYVRTSANIPVEANSLSDPFSMIFCLPTSSGDMKEFTFIITKDDIQNQDNKEISLDEAIANFGEKKAKEYFKKHMNEYISLTGDEIKNTFFNNEWNIGGLFTKGNAIAFDNDGYSVDLYGTKRQLVVVDNMMDLKLASKSDPAYEVRKINDNAYLLISNGNPLCVFYK